MSYNDHEEKDKIICSTDLILKNIANQFDKLNDNKYYNIKKVSTMGKMITNINNELLINNELDIRYRKNEAILPPSPTADSNFETSEKKYETLITDPWNTNRNVCAKAMKDEKKYVYEANYEKKVRNLRKARSIKYKKQNLVKKKKIPHIEKDNKKIFGIVPKRRRKKIDVWDPSVPNKWSSSYNNNNNFILIDF